MLCGLSAGLSLADMRPMRVTDLANIVGESSAMRSELSGGGESEVRDATDDDVRWLMSL